MAPRTSRETLELDIDHLAELANLPLDGAERGALAEACRDVLDAFGLEDVAAGAPAEPPVATFEDVPAPWPPDGVDALLDQVPERDGRRIRA